MSTSTFKILVGLDFSDASAGAMYHAVTLAERLHAELHLSHITRDSLVAPTDLGLNVPDTLEEARDAREQLERIRAMIAEKVSTVVHLRTGDPVKGMLQLITELKPNMVVIGSHGKGAVERFLMGSVSTELVQKSPAPVLVIPAPGRAQLLTQAVPKTETSLPAVGTAVEEPLPDSYTSTSTSVGVGVSPGGTSGYDVNPELRVRY